MSKGSEMKHFLAEYQFANGSRNGFVDLPDPAQIPVYCKEIRIPREAVVKFRNDFRLLMDFASLMCGKPIIDLCPLDLLAPFLKMAAALDDLEESR